MSSSQEFLPVDFSTMNQVSHDQPESLSDPRLVLESICRPKSAPITKPVISTGNHWNAEGELVSLRINPESAVPDPLSPDFLENQVESAKQIQQLAGRLKQTERDLEQREAKWRQEVEAWRQSVADQESEFDLRVQGLQQQGSQIRIQQLHLQQLQTDIVKSHDATRAAIESLVTEFAANPDNDQETINTLKAIQYELSGRFDYISRRWEHLAKLMQATQDQDIASSVDDRVRWTECE